MGWFNSSSHHLVLIVTVVLSLYQFSLVSGIFFERVHVYVLNELEPGKTLSLHCKSKDDDLGMQQIIFNQTYEWSFHNNFFGRTLFWCFMSWEKSLGVYASGSFNIYEGSRDQFRCRKRCWWKIKEDGLFSLNRDSFIWEHLYDWP
ncbi:hypothetical protein L1049_028602 [Liquidambar formosana]|uniref:S-protein homolog n=1 Tax=Liquidambar formosana TaxID=63359 RepID=A0AAP0N5C5_LIQFO